MGSYLFAYRFGTMPEGDAEREASMAAWGAFIGGLASVTVDRGNPFGAGNTIASSGAVTEGTTSGVNGYTIITADDLASATELAKGCPSLSAGGSVEVHEIHAIM